MANFERGCLNKDTATRDMFFEIGRTDPAILAHAVKLVRGLRWEIAHKQEVQLLEEVIIRDQESEFLEGLEVRKN